MDNYRRLQRLCSLAAIAYLHFIYFYQLDAHCRHWWPLQIYRDLFYLVLLVLLLTTYIFNLLRQLTPMCLGIT